MPFDGNHRNCVPLQTVAEWDRIRKGQLNPLNLDESVLEVSSKLAPPKKFKGGYHLGRYLVEGFARFHRKSALKIFGQTFYIIDIYEFDTPLDRRVARNLSNHHKDVTLSQTINDYVSEIKNAANAGEILMTETAVSELAWRLAEGWRLYSAKVYGKSGICCSRSATPH